MRRIRVAITGATGQLGSALIANAPVSWVPIPITRADAELFDWEAVNSAIATANPDIVIHAAANTDVDGCEKHPEIAYQSNASGTRFVAQAAATTGSIFMYISTNFIFSGIKSFPYHEFDSPDPINVYGKSKLAGEYEAMAIPVPVYIIRTSQIFNRTGRNFVNTMLNLMSNRERISVVADQFGNPSYATDLAHGIYDILEKAPPGIYHLTNSGVASWYQWAVQIANVIDSSTEIVPIPGSEYERPAQPPQNGALSSMFLPELGIQLPDWKDALQRCLSE